MSPPPNTPQRQGWLQGVREVLGFVRAALVAVGEMVIGRWPTTPSAPGGEPEPAPPQHPSLAEKIEPFPVHD